MEADCKCAPGVVMSDARGCSHVGEWCDYHDFCGRCGAQGGVPAREPTLWTGFAWERDRRWWARRTERRGLLWMPEGRLRVRLLFGGLSESDGGAPRFCAAVGVQLSVGGSERAIYGLRVYGGRPFRFAVRLAEGRWARAASELRRRAV